MYTDFLLANSLVAMGDEEGRVRLMESAKDPNSVRFMDLIPINMAEVEH
jgi:hypothetical protein